MFIACTPSTLAIRVCTMFSYITRAALIHDFTHRHQCPIPHLHHYYQQYMATFQHSSEEVNDQSLLLRLTAQSYMYVFIQGDKDNLMLMAMRHGDGGCDSQIYVQ